MQHDITKLCADSLRIFLNDKYGIKLKSGHAHEIVASFFGYKSKIALLADKQYALSNLEEAEFILLSPDISDIDQRIQSLQGLPTDLPSSQVLAEVISSIIAGNGTLAEKVKWNIRELAIPIAEECIHKHVGRWQMNPMPKFILNRVEMETTEAMLLLNVTFGYHPEERKLHEYCKVDIKLRRIAGNIGYGMPEMKPTFYSGKFRDPDYSPDDIVKAEAKS